MEAVALSDLWPIIVAVLGPMLLCVTALARYQHVDSVKIHRLIAESNEKNRGLIEKNRDLIERTSKENRDLIERTSKENRDLIEKNRDLIAESNEKNRDLIERTSKENRDLIERTSKENRDLIMKNHAAISDVRERLARIEGHVAITPPPRQETDDDGDAKAA